MSQGGPQPDRGPLPLELEQQIDRVSDEFERAWQTGQTPRIEDYLDRVPAGGKSRLLEELLVVESDLRELQGQPLNADAYRQRFPGSDAIIDAALALRERRQQDDLSRTAPHLAVRNADDEQQRLPQQIGRFLIRRRLGQGGFGVVYLAHDPGLDRLVALKVPRSELLATGQQRENFLHEARTAAKLKHPSLVTVHEVQQETELIYIVQEYIEGQNLAQWAAAQPRSWEDITHRLIEITTAIGYVHQQGFYHRDLKPGNILIDNEGHAHVADFGLAVHEDALRVLKGKAPGTPPYMSPEQCRGETHWIDGRTDIWALGVILYELLAGRRPFAADSVLELFTEIQERDPKSPRMKNPDIPKELERICFKCLAKRRTQRYANASDLREDLQAFLVTCADSKAAAATDRAAGASVEPGVGVAAGAGSTIGPDADSTPRPATPTPDSGSQPPLRVVPKGLRSFDEDDKDFFLELLPGPRDREGLPDSIRFWKTRIERMDADATFAVGVMYGPSGCGKSSLVKAGLLPHLAAHVLPIFVEATPSDTELRLLKMLRKHIPRLAAEASLAEALAQLREGRVTEGRKVLLVLDQFEQWLHVTANLDGSQLVRALRQCDGAKVQCLILVRDDFWLSSTRFMQALEVLQVENQNSAVVDLFDPSHARKVLRAFGLAYGRLPEHDLSVKEQQFLDRAVQDLALDGKVICVQLSLFADMMKGRPWTPASLQEVGGTSGVGVAFLDETFTAKTAPPTHRLHAKAAQAVLKSLLPEVGTNIKGQMQPAERLLECSGYAARPDDFRDLLQILNRELRLITPTEFEEAEPTSVTADRGFYQLTHDYLVLSLRDWLTRKQKESWRGRAELTLAERTSLWTSKSDNRHLPSCFEFFRIFFFTKIRSWTESQKRMMQKACVVHSLRLVGVAALLLIVALSIAFLVRDNRRRNAEALVAAALAAPADGLPYVTTALRPLAKYADKILRERMCDTGLDFNRRLHAACVLAEIADVDHHMLTGAIACAPPAECSNIVRAMGQSLQQSQIDLNIAIQQAEKAKDWNAQARYAIVSLHLGFPTPAIDMLQVVDRPDPVKRTKFIAEFRTWHGSLFELADLLGDGTNPALASGLCLAVGSIGNLDNETTALWLGLLDSWFRQCGDSGTHSAAGWALRQLNGNMLTHNKPLIPPDDSEWIPTSSGLTMVRITSGTYVRHEDNRDQAITIVHDYLISDCEIPLQLFDRFIMDSDYRGDKPQNWGGADMGVCITPSHPVQNVSWCDAVMFCNWLSHNENRQECYTQVRTTEPSPAGSEESSPFDSEEVTNMESTDGKWEMDAEANGYRLPTEHEWEYACRAGTRTEFAFGDDPIHLGSYGAYRAESTEPIGTKMCNGWGLFDMHGNVYEWCQEWYVQPEPANGSQISTMRESLDMGIAESGHVTRGGSWVSDAKNCRSFFRNRNSSSHGENYLGFRVVASVLDNSSGH